MSESIQHKLSRVRPPRVQITYDVETGGALEKKEIPFIIGIIAPLSGRSSKVLAPLRQRKMVQIDRDNFNKVMDSIAPKVIFNVPNTLPNETDKELGAAIRFNHIDHFDPVEVVKRIPKLQQIFIERSRLRDFLAKLDGNDGLNHILTSVLTDKKTRDGLKADIDSATKALDKALATQLDELLKVKTVHNNGADISSIIDVAPRKLDAARQVLDEKKVNEAILASFKNQLGKDTLIESMLSTGKLTLEEGQIPYALELITEFCAQLIHNDDLLPETVTADTTVSPPEGETSDSGENEAVMSPAIALIEINVAALLTTRISQKDKAISRQLNHILHHEDFQNMEASWRGLHYLVMNTETSKKLKLKVLNVDFDELYKDLDKAVEFDQSALFKIVYEDEYGTYGGEPYSALVGDFQLGRTARDIKFLQMISGVAAAAHAPFIASAYAKLFDLEDFGSLYQPRDLSKIFESAELIKWRSFRESEDSRYVTLTLPRVMLRLPYHHENNPVEGIYFDEDVAINLFVEDDKGNKSLDIGTDDEGIVFEKTSKKVSPRKILWGNPAYILAQRIGNAFSLYGWTAAIRGVEGGGLIEGLPAYTFETEEGDIALNCPTEVSITDRREKELNDLGFMSICHCKGTDKAAFFGGQTANKPKLYMTDFASANARISAMLPYILAASRFAHYIKVIMREKIGSFMTRQNVEDFLNTWIAQYVLLDDTPPQQIKAKYPLREAKIVVTDVPGKPGAYRATVFLKPHFQLEELTTSIRLVADLPS